MFGSVGLTHGDVYLQTGGIERKRRRESERKNERKTKERGERVIIDRSF